MPRSNFLLLLILFVLVRGEAQQDYFDRYEFSAKDSVRGVYGPLRSNYDVKSYLLDIKINPSRRYIDGSVTIRSKALNDLEKVQIDLYDNMEVLYILYQGKEVTYRRIFNAIYVDFGSTITAGNFFEFEVRYRGKPRVARNAPWDGGFVWKSDKNNDPWVGVACEGDGASLWWPCKDHPLDEPDSMHIRVAVPKELTCVSNGNLIATKLIDQEYKQWHWRVGYPINNYNVTVNIANYAHFSETYISPTGDSLDCDYYVLPYNLEKAKKQFKQVGPMLDCYDHYLGPYPFWEDGFCLVETPYLGMEHQSAIAYGNGYQRGYRGGMQAEGQDWDYIIIHESGHEWFGNAVSAADHGDMWIHESFTTYMEALYVECIYGFEEAIKHLNVEKALIRNIEPIIGPYDVAWDKFRSSDHYMKGTWVLHTLRNAIQDDEKWFSILKGFYNTYKYQTISTKEFEDYLNTATDRDWTAVLNQYLRYRNVPQIEIELKEKKGDLEVKYRWLADVEGFDMPILFGKKGEYIQVFPTNKWQRVKIEDLQAKEFEFPIDLFLVSVEMND
jgi:aminopeptidase N